MKVWNYVCQLINTKVNGKKVKRSEAYVNTILLSSLLTTEQKCDALIGESRRLCLWQLACEDWEIWLHFIIDKFICENNLSLFDLLSL